jgi:predicted  nucleic acid-binding Zn-ribbon protein
MYDDGAKELLSGCSCGGRFFFFMKKAKVKEATKISEELTTDQRKQIESDVQEIVGDTTDEPVFLDIESIRVLSPGKYELDLVELFKKEKPIVYKIEDGKYIIDLVASLNSIKEKN